MISRRLALAVGLLLAIVASQLPEFTQQYRQRLGGAIDELSAVIAQFDGETAALSLDRDQGIARLQSNGDALARGRGASMADLVVRRDRLERQRAAFGVSGPLSQYAVLVEDLDSPLARRALSDFQPAVPVTTAGFVTAALGFLLGWLVTLAVTTPTRRPAPVRSPHATGWH